MMQNFDNICANVQWCPDYPISVVIWTFITGLRKDQEHLENKTPSKHIFFLKLSLTIRVFTTLQSEPRDLWPLRHLIRQIFGRFSDFWKIFWIFLQFQSGHVSSPLWSNVSGVTSLWGHSVVLWRLWLLVWSDRPRDKVSYWAVVDS